MNIRTAFSSKRTLRHELDGVKERVEPYIKGVVYKIDCECGHTYIGETGRSLSIGLKSTNEQYREETPIMEYHYMLCTVSNGKMLR